MVGKLITSEVGRVAVSSNMVAFHSDHSAAIRSKMSLWGSFRLARSIGSSTTLKRNVLSRIFKYL